jgi:hypothetical protein
MTLGAAAAVRLIVWCQDCGHQVEPDPAEMAAPYGAETTAFAAAVEANDGSRSMPPSPVQLACDAPMARELFPLANDDRKSQVRK